MVVEGPAPAWRVRLAKSGEPEEEGYRAFTLTRDGNPVFFDVQGREGGGQLLPYRALLSVAYTGLPDGAWLVTLATPGQAVLIEGRHLGELVRRLKLGDVDAIHEFDPTRWPEPAEGTAVVTALSLTTAHQPALPPA